MPTNASIKQSVCDCVAHAFVRAFPVCVCICERICRERHAWPQCSFRILHFSFNVRVLIPMVSDIETSFVKCIYVLSLACACVVLCLGMYVCIHFSFGGSCSLVAFGIVSLSGALAIEHH